MWVVLDWLFHDFNDFIPLLDTVRLHLSEKKQNALVPPLTLDVS